MRLHILGDLHFEFGPTKIPVTDADVVVLAGDILLGRDGHLWARNQFFAKPVIYVLGNHEFYRHSLPELTETVKRDTEGSNIHLLENSAVEIDGYTFLGCTLWTDFQLDDDPEGAMRVADALMSDYGLIQFSTEKRGLRAHDTARLHAESVAWLRRALAKCDRARTIVVTHHAPSARSEAPYHADSPFKAAFASNLDSFVKQSGVPLWIHGHTHFNADYMIGKTRVVTNQLGYPDERCKGFNPSLIVEI